MKVLLINGSPRPKGNTFIALSRVAERLKEHGVDSEIVQIGTKPMRGCIACKKCRELDKNRCVFDDDLCNRVAEKLESSDALIIGSPTYYGQPNGTLLSLIQRLFYSAGALAKNKPASAVAVCRRGGASAALQSLNMPFQILNMPMVTSQYWNLVYGQKEGEAEFDAEGLQTMRTLADNMAWLLKKIHAAQGPDYPDYEPMTHTNFIR